MRERGTHTEREREQETRWAGETTEPLKTEHRDKD